MGPPPRCGQTNKVKLLPSRRTTYAGGKKTFKLVSSLISSEFHTIFACPDITKLGIALFSEYLKPDSMIPDFVHVWFFKEVSVLMKN